MKPVFKCDYCSKMGTKEEIKEHEPKCMENYDRENCHTCVHKILKSNGKQWFYECKAGKEIPVGAIFEFCKSYKRKEKNNNPFNDLFGDVFKF